MKGTVEQMKRYTTTQTITSPIEQAMRSAIIDLAVADGFEIWDFSSFSSNGEFDPRFGHLLIITDDPYADGDIYGDGNLTDTLNLYANAKIGTYKIDFVLQASYGAIAIECDGHDWHDRTKQQAAYDRARDRWMNQNNMRTLRFTGSEIYHYPHRCAQEALDCLRIVSATECAMVQAGIHVNGAPLLRGILEQEKLAKMRAGGEI